MFADFLIWDFGDLGRSVDIHTKCSTGYLKCSLVVLKFPSPRQEQAYDNTNKRLEHLCVLYSFLCVYMFREVAGLGLLDGFPRIRMTFHMFVNS